MKTLKDFAEAARDLDNDGIYHLFEGGIPSYLRNEIYKLAEPDSIEPMRAAMIKLGYMFHVESLITY